jgi:hypothetical protein
VAAGDVEDGCGSCGHDGACGAGSGGGGRRSWVPDGDAGQ